MGLLVCALATVGAGERLAAPLSGGGEAVAREEGERVRLVAPLEAGSVLRYDIGVTLEVGSEKGVREKMEQHARVRLTVAEVADGVTTVRGAFESVSVDLKPAQGEERKFSWKEGQELDEKAPPLEKLYGMLVTTPIELKVGENGVVKEVSGPEKAESGADGITHPERALGVLGSATIGRTLAPVFGLDPEGKERKQGESWNESAGITSIGAAKVKMTIARTLKKVDAGAAEVEATITQGWQAGPGKADPTQPTGEPSEQHGSSKERWDRGAGRLVSRISDLSLTWTTQLQTMPPMETVRDVKSHVELKRVE